jgi:copper transport protein
VRRRLLALLIALGGLLGLALVLAPAASAHATVVGSTPVDGSRLKTIPSTVEIDFDESVTIGGSLGYLHVIDQAGRRVDVGTTVHPGGDGSKISIGLKPGLGDGTYTGSFRVISADSHPVSGAIRFVVGNGSLAAAAITPSTVNHTTSLLFDVVRWTAFAGLALLGSAWLMFSFWTAGRDDLRARRLVRAGWWISVLGAAAELLIQGPYAAGLSPSSLFNASLLDATLHTTYGTAHALRLIALGLLGAILGTLLRRVEPGRGRLEQAGGLLVVGVAVSFASSGHAASEHPEWLATLSDTLHLVAMAVWFGGLIVLAVALLPRREPDELRAVLPNFSRVAYVCVAVLAVTGTYQAILGIGSWRAVTETTYGLLVMLKIGLFGLLLALGNLSRGVVQRRWVQLPTAYAMADTVVSDGELAVEDEPEQDVSPLRRSVLVELVVAAGVLAASAVLTASPPGASGLITRDSKPQTVTAQLGDGQSVAVTLSSRRHGDLAVTLTPSAGLKPESLTATAAQNAQHIGPLTIPLTQAAGAYSASGVLFPAAGAWVITLNVRTSQFNATVADVTVTLH